MTAHTTNEADSVYRIAVRRALAAGDATALQLHFDVAVLQRYRESGGFSIIRTNAGPWPRTAVPGSSRTGITIRHSKRS